VNVGGGSSATAYVRKEPVGQQDSMQQNKEANAEMGQQKIVAHLCSNLLF
jgi:hypothetical protein